MDGMARSYPRSGSSVRGHFFWFSSPNLVLITGDYADVFDGAMIVLAMYTLNIFHPGIFLRDEKQNYPSQTSSGSEGMAMEDRLKTTYHQGRAV